MKKNIFIHLITSTATLLITAAFFTAGAASIQQEVVQARADCYAHKLRVMAIEAKLAESDPRLAKAKSVWESSCYQASVLMDAKDDE